jgi:hypothetical protein
MQGWGNVLGVILSAIAVIFTGLLFRHERNVRREEKEDADAAQARLVMGKIIRLSRGMEDDVTEPSVGPAIAAVWQVRNYSSMPVFNLEVWVGGRFDAEPNVFFLNSEETYDVVEDRLVGSVESTEPIQEKSWGDFDLSDYDISIAFTDANGLMWTRVNVNSPQRLLDYSREHSRFKEFLWAWAPKKLRVKRQQVEWRLGRTWAAFKVRMRVASPNAVKRYDDAPPF